MKSWLRGTAAIVAVATVAALSACSGAGGGGKTEISFLMWGDGGDTQKAYESVVAGFEKKNPDITVNAEFFNTDDYDSLLKTRLSGGAGPDVYGFDLGNIDKFIKQGYAADLTKTGGESYLSKLLPDALKDSQRGGTNGDSYSMPVTVSGNGVIYNKSLFEKAGISEAPDTYPELLADAKKLKDAGITPFAMSAKDNWWPQFIVYYPLAELGANEQTGADMMAGKTTFSDNTAWRESLNIVKELTPYYMANPLGTSQASAQSAFLTGKAAMFPATWILNDARKAKLDIGYMNFPTTDTPDAQVKDIWGTYQVRFGVNPTNGKTEAAQKFMKYFFSDAVYSDFVKKVAQFPVTKTVTVGGDTDPLFPEMQAAWKDKTFVAAFSPTDTTIQNQLLVGMQNIIGGKSTVDQTLQQLDASLKQFRASNK